METLINKMKKKLKKAQTGTSTPVVTSPEMIPNVENVKSYRDSSAMNNDAYVNMNKAQEGEYAYALEKANLRRNLELAKAEALRKFNLEKMKNNL